MGWFLHSRVFSNGSVCPPLTQALIQGLLLPLEADPLVMQAQWFVGG